MNMKKNLISGVAALMLCGVLSSCSHDTAFDEQSYENNIINTYEQAFRARFGNPAPNQDWGFGSSANVRTRAGETAPAPTYVGPTFNAQLAEAATNTGKVYNDHVVTYEQIAFLAGFRSWDNSGWSDAFYQINPKTAFSSYSEDYLAQARSVILNQIPEGYNNLSKAQQAGYSITTKGGPVTLTPIYHNSSSADMISYYYYPVGSEPSVEQIKAMKKYTIGYMADPDVCKGTTDPEHETFYHYTYNLVYVDGSGQASYDFPANYVICFIISNVDYAHNFDVNIFDKVGPNGVETKAVHNYPEYYGDGRLNVSIHNSAIGMNNSQWNLPSTDGDITDPETPHAAVFSIGEKNYVGFEDWKDFDYNDVIFEVTGTGGGTPIPPVDEWEEMRVIAEDLTVDESTDFDFNDVVFDVRRYTKTTANHQENEVEVILRAAGGTLPLYVAGYEVHAAFRVEVHEMVNTNAQGKGLAGQDRAPVTLTLQDGDYSGSTIEEIANSIDIYVMKNTVPVHLSAPLGGIASKIGVKSDFKWCEERQDIERAYSLTDGKSPFKDWVQGTYIGDEWYRYAHQSIISYREQQ